MKQCMAVMALALATTMIGAETPTEMDGLPLVFSDDFTDGLDKWEMTDAKAWEANEMDGDRRLVLKGASDYDPPVRSPHNIAWIKDLNVGDFILDVDCKQTGKEYGHRDLCFFFNKQDPAHFYYVHLATTADAHANSIFLVNDKPRVSIAKKRTDGTDWGKGPHKIRIKRDATKGTIEVYFDHMKNPVMTTSDTHFTTGTIGLGSFDDTGWFDNVRVYGKILPK
jgi:hypothetical protein